MDITFLESLLFGFVSGVSEFMPVSSVAHQQMMLRLFGQNSLYPLLGLFIHIGMLAAVVYACMNHLQHMKREEQIRRIPKRRRRRQPDHQMIMDTALVKGACVPMLLGYVFYLSISKWENLLPTSAAILVLNGLVLHIPVYFTSGNKDSRSMTRLDGIAIGLSSALGVLPGMSRIGVAYSYGSVRAADYAQVYKWCLLLSIPALFLHVIFDLILLFTLGLTGVELLFVVYCILAAVMAWLGATLAIRFARLMCTRTGLGGLSYYCWGVALFMFILYLYT